ncbi:cupin domain-containing protein [Micromonospora sp. CPCC 205561]|uniref:cupin domain-containing protein n=1 Tax=Micromonospora sp. CPCC 205561 TaxID=3122407 RepID=UPI002FF1DF53
MEIRRFDQERLANGYGIDYELLLPWPALNAPFEGAWCVVPPGGAAAAHAHHEYEIFIGMVGRGELVVDGRRRDFAAGDIARLTPGSHHQVVNPGDREFSYYAIWWDTEMSARFVDRHRAEG